MDRNSLAPSPALLDEASAWIARLSNDQASEADHQNFALWLARSASHRQAYDEVESLWLDLGCVKYTAPAAPSALLDDQPRPEDSGVEIQAQQNGTRSLWQRLKKPGNFAAALALCGIAALIGLQLISQQLQQAESQTDTARYATAVGEQRTVTLEDGSRVMLNTNTRLEVSYLASERRLLLSQGEAHFEVRKNAQRPFVVEVPGASVVAVGTAFNIEIEPQQTLVTVTEGVVRVEENNNSALSGDAVTARYRDRIVVSPVSGLKRSTLENLDVTNAWQQQNLVFKDVSLAHVVAELNRYSSRKIKISDASLAYLQVSGVFKLDQPLKTLQAIEASLGLQRKEQGNIVLLYKPA